VRRVGKRREAEMVEKASGLLLAEGARFNEAMAHLAPTMSVPKGVYRFKSHEEANRHEFDCLVRGMVGVALNRR
jgi:hypothetical protein